MHFRVNTFFIIIQQALSEDNNAHLEQGRMRHWTTFETYAAGHRPTVEYLYHTDALKCKSSDLGLGPIIEQGNGWEETWVRMWNKT